MSLAGQAWGGLSASGKHGSLARLWSEGILSAGGSQLAGPKGLLSLSPFIAGTAQAPWLRVGY